MTLVTDIIDRYICLFPFQYALYDLQEDPYETNNLYDSDDDDISDAQVSTCS